MGIGNALIDRHDVTEQRHPQPSPVIPGNTDELTRVLYILTEILRAPNVSEEFVVMNTGSNVPAEAIEPHKGIRRTIAQRTAIAPMNTSIPTNGAPIFPDNPNRFGGAVINTGTSPLLIVLGVDFTGLSGSPFEGSTGPGGYGTLWLAANGGSWNMKLTDVLWAGSVFGFGIGGTTTIAGTEI